MYRQEEYCRILTEELKKYRLDTMDMRYQAVLNRKMDKEYEWLNYDAKVIEEAEKLVGRKSNVMIASHAMLYKLFRKDFGLEPNVDLSKLGVTYTLLGCGFDKLIDNPDNPDRQQYIDLLKKFAIEQEFAEEDSDIIWCSLMEKMSHTYIEMSKQYSELDSTIVEMSRRAIGSEVFVSECDVNDMGDAPRNLVTDKSDKFTMVGILLAMMDVDAMKAESVRECAQLVGDILLLIDDLSDLYEDIEQKQVNSLVYDTHMQMQDEAQMQAMIDRIIEFLPEYVLKLDSCRKKLLKHLSNQTMDFVNYLINHWLSKVIDYN
jgi:hypothetical protein